MVMASPKIADIFGPYYYIYWLLYYDPYSVSI